MKKLSSVCSVALGAGARTFLSAAASGWGLAIDTIETVECLRLVADRNVRAPGPVTVSRYALYCLILVFAATSLIAEPGQSLESARSHWAYQPIRNPAPPKVRAARRVQSPVDAFLLAKLEEKELGFAPPADKRTLLRRVYYDLIGLPPAFEEIQAFERDSSRGAFARVVDRLLASPRYGERWGRHWLDAARYADTKDLVLVYGKDALRPYAYTYRDYVIRAFNEDLPFNQFVQDQLAADLLEPKIPPWRLAALGFLTLGRLFDNNPHDQIDDQIDTTTRGFLGMTVACARCHDHKYDAIRQADYYGLYGVFASTEQPYDLPLIEDPKQVPGGVEFEQQFAQARQELEQHIDAEFAKLTESFRQRIGDYLVRAATTKPDLAETAQFALSLTPEAIRPTLMLRTRRWIERRATPDDRVFGPWADLMAWPDEKFAAQAADNAGNPDITHLTALTHLTNSNPLVLAALEKTSLTNKASVAHAYGQLLRDIYEESKKPVAGSPNGGLNADQRELLEVLTGKDGPLWFPRRDTPDHMSRSEKDHYNKLVAALDKLAVNATNAPPARAMVVADLPESYQPHIFRRGNPSRPGEPVQRAFLRVLSNGDPRPFGRGSGRLDLARAIASPANPLTARVLVNRVWMHHFGEPLVSSTTDFGTRSLPPTHPELLDWLAADFIHSGWSVKHLHRVIVLSAAYQQASVTQASVAADVRRLKSKSEPTKQPADLPPRPFGRGQGRPVLRSAYDEGGGEGSVQKDAENKLLSHFPRRRLDFEAMRDSLLLISGRLDTTAGGRSVDIAGDPLNQRRTVYGLVDRQDLPGMFRAFDFPVPDQCVERRSRTTVPQQALFALNSAFVMEQARALAASPQIAGIEKPAERIGALFRRVLGRQPAKTETASALRFIEAAKADAQPEKGLTPWEQLAQVMLISNEAVFLD